MTRFVVLLMLCVMLSFTWAAPIAPTIETNSSVVAGDVGDEKVNTTTIPQTTTTTQLGSNSTIQPTGNNTGNATNFQVYGLAGQPAGFVVHAKNLSFFTNSTKDSDTNNTNTIIGLVVGFGVFGFIILLLSSAK